MEVVQQHRDWAPEEPAAFGGECLAMSMGRLQPG